MARSYSVSCAEEQDDLALEERGNLLSLLCSAGPETSTRTIDGAGMARLFDEFLADCRLAPPPGSLADGGLYGYYSSWCDTRHAPSESRLSEPLFKERYAQRTLKATDRANAIIAAAVAWYGRKGSGRQAAG